ncbi:MAG: hypothetical protein AAFP26_04305 [Planctomycetota bacterium]
MVRLLSTPIRPLALSAALLAASAGTAAANPSVLDAPSAKATDAASMLDRASDLLTGGSAVRARAMLLELTRPAAMVSLTDAERTRAFQLLTAAERRVRSLPRTEVAVQKAELAIASDDLVEAERQARSTLADGAAEAGQQERASAVLMLVSDRRDALAPALPGALQRAVDLFERGDYAEAKAGFDAITRVGGLDEGTGAVLAGYRDRVVELELARGRSFESPAMLSAMGGSPAADWLLDSAEYQPVQVEDVPPGEVLQPQQPTTQPAPAVDLVESQPARSGSFMQDDGPVDVIEAARTFEAKSLLGEANRAYEERRLSEAMRIYNRLLAEYAGFLTPAELAQANERRAEAQVQLGAQGGPDSDVLSDAIQDRELQLQRVRATFNNLMEQADRSLAEGDVTAARDLVAQARLVAGQGRSVMSEPDYEAMILRVEDKLTELNEAEETIRTAEAEARAEQLSRETAEAESRRLSERDRQINESLGRVRALQLELKYDEALQVVEQILFRDPTNPAGLLLKDVLEDTLIYRRHFELQREKGLGLAFESIDNQEAMVPPRELVNYPADWPEISLRRGEPLQFSETPGDRAVLATLDDTALPVNFNDNALVDVIGFIQANTNINIDVDWTSLEDIGIERETPVTLSLSAVPVRIVLDRVLEKVSDPDLPASWSVSDGILTIASDEVLRRNTTLEIYDIRDLIFVVPDFDEAPDFDLSSVLQSGQGGGGQSPFSGNSDSDVEIPPREERVQQIVDLIQANVDPDGWADLGGDTGAVQELNGNLIVTNTPRNHRAIIGLLNKLRQVRSMQINVEARFLLVDQNFFEQIGFDLDVYLTDNNEFDIAQLIDPSIDGSDFFDNNGQLVDNVTGGGIFPTDTDGDGVVDGLATITQPVFSPGTQGDEFSVVQAAQNSFGLTETLASASSFASSILGAQPALGITGRFLDDIQVDFLVEATQADQRSVSLTAPRLTFTNGQRANISVATQQSFVSDLTPVVSDSAVSLDPTVDVVSDGVVLDLTGVVSADRRYVTLNVQTALSDITFGEDRSVQAAAGGGGIGGGGGGAVAEGSIQLPIATVTQINTSVTIPDQGTVLLGGQRLVNEVEVETGVPVLSKIPILSRFFSNRIDSTEESTLLILLKPTILIQSEEEEAAFPGLADQLGY